MKRISLRWQAAASVVACLVSVCAIEVFALESVDWTGQGDLNNTFGDPDNFGRWESVDGKPTYVHRLPEVGWRVVMKPGAPDMHIRDEDAALAASLADFYKYEDAAAVYWDVTTNCTLYAGLAGSGQFYKMGKDTTLQFANGGQFAYQGHYTVAEGTLKLHNYVGRTRPYSAYVYGWCTVSNGATLVMCNADTATESSFNQVICYGLFTNENPSVRHVITSRDSGGWGASLMAGDLGGNINLRLGQGVFNITSTNNTFTQFFPRSGDTTNQTIVGIMKFGNIGEATSSIGPSSTLVSEVGQIAGGSALYRYLGTGETTDKTLELKLDSKYAQMTHNPPSGLDGGPYGGAIFTGEWKTSQEYFQILRLTGSNSVPCQYNGIFTIKSANGIRYAPHILKDGTGVWRFNETFKRSWAYSIGLTGAFSIEEGIMQFDTLGEVGENCALGTAGDLYDKYVGVYDATKKVDWAYSFGTTNGTGVAEKEGTLEFVGTETAFASQRPISLLGNGRLKNSGTASLTLRGVSARVAGEHVLALDGANMMSNAVAEVSDGVEGAVVSVVKEGDGKWMLKGNTTFSGDIVVKGGELEVEANTNKFNWFRMTFRKAGNAYVSPAEVALYDIDGVRQNKGLAWKSGYTSGNSVPIRHECCDLAPGEIFYGCSGSGAYVSSGSGLPAFTVDNASSSKNGHASLLGVNPTEEVPYNWIPIVMRLTNGANEIVSFDICQADGWPERQPTSYSVDGSLDGVNWYPLNDTPYDENWELPGARKWYSYGDDFVAGDIRKLSEGKGFAIAGHPEVSSLPNVRSVRVDTNATLKTTYENVGAIKALTVSAAGCGTIDGFKFAANGTVDIVDAPEKGVVDMPITIVNDGGTAANIASWPITVGGIAQTRRHAMFTGTSFRLVPHGATLSFR